MSAEGPQAEGLRIAITCEDQAHRALVTFLTDRVLLDEAARRDAPWFDDASIQWYRRYCGLEEGDEDDGDDDLAHLRYYPLDQAKKDAEAFGERVRIGGRPVKLRGHIGGKPLGPEAALWRRVFVLFGVLERPPDVLIVVRDTDGKVERHEGLRQALAIHEGFPVITATPHQDAEAWFVAGFVPRSAAERSRLEECKRVLGFYPPEKPDLLTAHPNDSPADAKRVLRVLLFNENRSRPPALDELPEVCERTLSDLALLEQRGAGCLLLEFLRQIRQILAPVIFQEGGALRRAPPH